MFIQPTGMKTQRSQKPAFQRNFSVQKLSKAMSKETTPINPQHKLAKLFKKQQEGSFEELKKAFTPDNIENFVFMGLIKRNGKDWKKTAMADLFISEFYRTPTPIEKLWGRRMAAKQRELGLIS